MTRVLYHFTCDHGREALGKTGLVKPPAQWAPEAAKKYPEGWGWLGEVCWFTDLARPDAIALGLTSATLGCDRTRWRYRVTDDTGIKPWAVAARSLPRTAWQLTIGDYLPGRWWLAWGPVPVQLDPAPGMTKPPPPKRGRAS